MTCPKCSQPIHRLLDHVCAGDRTKFELLSDWLIGKEILSLYRTPDEGTVVLTLSPKEAVEECSQCDGTGHWVHNPNPGTKEERLRMAGSRCVACSGTGRVAV